MPVIDTSYATRVRLATAIIALLILVSSLAQLRSSFYPPPQLPETRSISQYEQRFKDIKGLLPAGQVTIYGDNLSGLCEPFVLAQYSLVPAILNTRRTRCGRMEDIADSRATVTNLRLGNLLDSNIDPYEWNMFPEGRHLLHPDPQTDLFPGEQVVLLKDGGHGIKLYTYTGGGK